MPLAATPDPRLRLSTAWIEMGNRHPSPAPPCPHTPGSGLAAFRTSPSLDWVSPVAPAENTVLEHRSTFSFLGYFLYPTTHCTLGFSLQLSGPPHYDLTVCLPQCPLTAPSLSSAPILQPMYRTCVQKYHCTRDSSAVPINHSTILRDA